MRSITTHVLFRSRADPLYQIPETYTSLLAHYLGTVQGKLRLSLTNICQEKVDAADESESIRARARACRDALAANEPTVDSA